MKKFVCLWLALLCLLPCINVEADSGIIYIGSFSELAALSARVNGGDSMENKTVVLENDISIGVGFVPIGATAATPFSGSFDGGGNTVNISYVGGDFSALFGCVSGGTVKNVTVRGDVKGENYCALLVGRLYAYSFGQTAAVINCRAEGSVSGDSYVGGIVGYTAAAANSADASVSVSGCRFNGDVAGDMYVGGILGKAEATGGTFRAAFLGENCLAVGSVTAEGDVASLAGGIAGGVYAKDNASAGLVGCVADCNIRALRLAAAGIAGAVGAENATAFLDGCAAYGIASSPTVGGISADCGIEGVSVNGCIADISLFGKNIYVIAPGETSGCFAPDCGFAAEGVSLMKHGTLPAHPLYTPTDKPCGDVDGDGAVSAMDASIVLRYDAMMCTFGSVTAKAADVNLDGKQSPFDASLILRYDAMLIPSLPVNTEESEISY